MTDPFISTIKGSIGGLSEAISLAEDLEGVAKQVQDLGKKELSARAAWRRKQTHVSGDYGFVDAVDEYRRVKEALDLREQIKRETIAKWGIAAWREVELIEARQKEDRKKLFTDDGHDRAAMTKLKWQCFGAAFFITMILWATGVIHELAVAFYGD